MGSKQNNIIFVYSILVIAMIFWGTSYIFTSIVLESLDPISIVFIRLVLSSVMLWIFIVIFYRKGKIPFFLFKWIAVLAFFQPFIYFIGETYGLQRLSPVVTSLIISTIPVFTAIIMRVFFKEILTTINFIGIFISLSGVILMIVGKDMQIDVDVLGLVLLFIAVFAAVGYGIILNRLAANVHPVWLIAVQNTFAVFYFLPLFLLLREMPNFDHSTIFTFLTPQWEMWVCLLILSFFCSSLAFIFFTTAVGKIGVARSTVFSNLAPIFTAITSFLILGELLAPAKMIGIFVIILGLMLTQRKK